MTSCQGCTQQVEIFESAETTTDTLQTQFKEVILDVQVSTGRDLNLSNHNTVFVPQVAPKKPVAAAKPLQLKTPKKSVRAIWSKNLIVRSTAYNSTPGQTDSSPYQTATGARTRFGIVALSRDLLRRIPYGSRVLLEDMGSWAQGRGRGRYNAILSRVVFVVEDTMHPRKTATMDVWFPAHHQAVQWGVRRLRLSIVQVGR
jgi:3D (Asp-Asp-Asp) domain-containing protein